MNLAHEIATCPRLSVAQLRRRYAEVFGEPTNAAPQDLAGQTHRLAVAGLAEGDLVRARSPTRRRAGQRRRPAAVPAQTRQRTIPRQMTRLCPKMARAPLRLPTQTAACPARQPSFTRLYKGQQLQVTVLTERLRLQAAGLSLAQRRGQGHHRLALQRLPLLPPHHQPEAIP